MIIIKSMHWCFFLILFFYIKLTKGIDFLFENTLSKHAKY